MHIFYGLLRLLALGTDIWVWYFAKDLKLMEDEEEEKPEHDRHIEGADADDLEKEKNAKELEAFSAWSRFILVYGAAQTWSSCCYWSVIEVAHMLFIGW